MQKPIAHFPSSRPTPTVYEQPPWKLNPASPLLFLSLHQLWSLSIALRDTEHPLCQFGSTALEMSSPSLLPTPSLFKGSGPRVTKQSWCRCSAHQQENLLGCHQNCFSCKSKTYRLLWRNSTPSQTCYTIMLLHLNFENKLSPSELRVFLQTVFSITTAYSKVLVLQSLAIY